MELGLALGDVSGAAMGAAAPRLFRSTQSERL